MEDDTEKWYSFENCGVSIRVSDSGRPFRLDFFDYDAVKRVEAGEKENLTNEDKICPHLSPKGVDFLGKGDYWKREIRNSLLDAPDHDFEEKEIKNLVNKFSMVADNDLRNMVKEYREESEEEKDEEEIPETVEEEIEQRAEEIIKSENTLEKLNKELDNLIAGEETNRAFLFTLLISGKLNEGSKKQIVLIKGEAGGGKSTLMNLADAYKVKDVGRFTKHALDYSNLEGYEILRLKEIGDMDQEDQGLSTLKFLSADDEGYKVEYTVRDEETGEFTTKEKRIPPITVISSTTRIEIEGQFERRSWFVSPDESEEQTKRISKWKANKRQDEVLVKMGVKKMTDYKKSKKVLEKVVEKINPNYTYVPFPKSLHSVLGNKVLRVRGDFDKIEQFVEFYTLFHSYGEHQRPELPANEDNIVLSTPEDAEKAIEYAIDPLITMLSGIEERIREMLEEMENPQSKMSEKGRIIDGRDRKYLAKKLGKSDRTIRRYLNKLEAEGYVSSSKNGSYKEYELLEDVNNILTKSLDIAGHRGLPDKYLELFAIEGIHTIRNILDKAYEGVEPPHIPLDPYVSYLPEQDDVQELKEKAKDSDKEINTEDLDIEAMSNSVQDFDESKDSEDGFEIEPVEDGEVDEVEMEEMEIEPIEDGDREGDQNRKVKRVLKIFEEKYPGETPHIEDAATVLSDYLDLKREEIRTILKKQSQKGNITLKRNNLGV